MYHWIKTGIAQDVQIEVVQELSEQPQFNMTVYHFQIWFAKQLNYTPWLASLDKKHGTAEYE